MSLITAAGIALLFPAGNFVELVQIQGAAGFMQQQAVIGPDSQVALDIEKNRPSACCC